MAKRIKVKLNSTGQIGTVDASEFDPQVYTSLEAPEKPKKEQSLLSKILPILGGVAGGVLGAPLGPAGIIAGGAIGSGLGQVGSEVTDEEEGISGERILKETAFGAVGGVAGLGIGKVLRLGGKVASASTKGIISSSVRGGTHFSPTAVERATKAGFSLEDEFVAVVKEAGKKIPVGSKPINLLVDTVEGSGKNKIVTKGILNQNIDDAEAIIQQTIKTAGTNITISADDMISSLKSTGRMVKAELGKDLNTQQWNKIVADATKKYSKGFNLKKGMETSRYANEKFSGAIFAEAGAANAALAQKLEAEAIRNAIKDRFPEVADALAKQQKNIILREGLSKSYAQNISKGARLAKTNLINPLSWIDTLLNNQRSAGIAAKLQGGQIGASPMLGQVLSGGAGQAGARAFGGGAPSEAPISDTPYSPMGDISSQQETETATLPDGRTVSRQDFQTALINDYETNGGKNAKKIQEYEEAVFGKEIDKPLSTSAANVKSLAQSGTRGLEEAMAIYEKDPNVLTKQLLPGKFASRKFDSAIYRTVEAILRARSGAAVPEQEVRRYMTKLAPVWGDNAEAVAFKFRQLQQDFIDSVTNIEGTRGAGPSTVSY